MKGLKKPISVEFNQRSGLVSHDVAGKPMKSWQVGSLAEAFSVNYTFYLEGVKFTLRMGVDSDGNQTDEVELDIDGIYYKKHPYLNIDFGKLLIDLLASQTSHFVHLLVLEEHN